MKTLLEKAKALNIKPYSRIRHKYSEEDMFELATAYFNNKVSWSEAGAAIYGINKYSNKGKNISSILAVSLKRGIMQGKAKIVKK